MNTASRVKEHTLRLLLVVDVYLPLTCVLARQVRLKVPTITFRACLRYYTWTEDSVLADDETRAIHELIFRRFRLT